MRGLYLIAFSFPLLFAANIGVAQDENVISDFLSCDPLVVPSERLACFDTVLKQYKIQYGILDKSDPDALARADRDRPAALPRGRIGESRLPAANATNNDGRRRDDIRRNGFISRQATADDLNVPLQTTITAFNMNSLGDFRLRIAEGFIFKSADGPRVREDLTNREIQLTKNVLGQFRMKVDGIATPIPITPVQE